MEGNLQKMREALANLTRYGESDIRQLEQLAKRAIENDIYGGGIMQSLCEAIREGKEALSAPARQCDVGTPEEKYQRWVHFCEQRMHSCHNCECKSPVGCTFKFGDMPYIKEGGGGK